MPAAPTKFIGVRFPQELAEKLDAVLSHESSGPTEYIRSLVREDLRKRGMLPLTPKPTQPEPTAA